MVTATSSAPIDTASEAHELAIAVSGLKKRFKTTVALDGLDLKIKRGTVYGLLGPNGAGKTTTIRILATLTPHDGGTATVLGHDVKRDARTVRSKISLTGQFAAVDEELTGRENLILIGRLRGLTRDNAKARADELLQAFGLADAARRQARTYSGGMKRRLDIAASLIVTPEILFLDEPTSGLDPRSRNDVWDIIRAIAGSGTTVLLTTQYLEEADRLADRLAVIDHGKVIAEGTSSELKASVGANTVRVRLRHRADRPRAREAMAVALKADVHEDSDPFTLTATVTHERDAAAALTALSDAGLGVADFTLGLPSLDEVFFALTGRPAEPTADQEVAS